MHLNDSCAVSLVHLQQQYCQKGGSWQLPLLRQLLDLTVTNMPPIRT